MPYTFKHGDRPLDDYTIQRAVGSGGFGEVYYAISDGGREVALKYLRSNPDIELRGVSHCINLKSPHLVSIFDVKKDSNGEYFVIMEYCSGPSLSDLLIAEPNGFGPQKAAFFVREIAKGLSYLHDRGIVHRDLKPANLFFDDGYVKIGDYGLSKFISISRHSAQTSSIGTVHYMAPEIGSGNYSRGVDIYALGVILYEMLLGRVPFEGSTMAEVLMKHLTAQPSVENLPEPFGKVIRKALEKDPKVRYQTVNEMMDDLLDVAEVRDSLAGFSTQSLMGAVQQGSPDRGHTPMPSPNPPPKLRGYGVDARGDQYAGGSAEDLSKRVGKKFDRISRKVERKLAKLEGRKPGAYPPPVPGTEPQPRLAQITGPDRRRQMLLSLMLSAGISAVMALIIGNASGEAAMGISALLMIPAMAGGIGLSRYAIAWFAAEQGPSWAVRALRAICCAFPLAIGAIPMLAGNGGARNEVRIHDIASMAMERVNVAQVTSLAVDLNQIGLGLLIALTIMAVFGNWERTLLDSPNGELRIGSAFPRAFGTLMLGMMLGGIMEIKEEGLIGFPAAGIVAAVTLIIQINGWWINAVKGMPQPVAVESDGQRVRAEARRGWLSGKQAIRVVLDELDTDEDEAELSGIGASKKSVDPNAPLHRAGIIRAFWALISFALTSGIIVQSLALNMISTLEADEENGLIIGIVSCAIVLVFLVIRKTSPIRRPGFWLETIRPLIMTGMAAAVGVNTTILIREAFGITGDDYARFGLLCGTICPAMALVAFTLFTGGKKKLPKPFVTIGDGVGVAVVGTGVVPAVKAVTEALANGESVLDALDAIDSPIAGQAKTDDKRQT